MRSRSLLWSFKYAIEGIAYALRTQRNMRFHVFAAAGVLVGAVLLDVSRLEMIALLFAIGFVLTAELANTAIETTVDLAVDRFDPKAEAAKDVAAGGVLVSSVIALSVGYVVFFERMRIVLAEGFAIVRQSSVHLTVIALGLTALAVVAVKAFTHEGTFLRGGWPSGHTALAAAAATAIGHAAREPSAALLAVFITLLVAQSRVEGEMHTIPQVVFGALLGFLITTVVFQVFFF